MKDNPDLRSKYDEVFAKVAFTDYEFVLSARMETYNDETRVKTRVSFIFRCEGGIC